MRNQCNLIKDILPLYVEDMVSADTREFVREHLAHCAGCRGEFERMGKAVKFIPDTAPDTDIVPLKRVKMDLFIRRIQTICFTAVLACAIVTIVFGIITSPEFFPYSDNLLHVMDGPDGSVVITFDGKVTGYSCHEVFDTETETEIYRVNAWTTTWDVYSSNRGNQNMVIPFDRETEIQVFYAQNNGSEDVLIYGSDENTAENGVTLPRLILLPYFLFAFLALVILAILRVLLKNQQAILVWLDRAIPFPISYMAAQLCIKGINFTTYSSQRDFCMIALVAILLYFAMLTGRSLYGAKRNTSRDST